MPFRTLPTLHTRGLCQVVWLCGCTQTSIQAEGFRSLRESEPVEYELEEGEDGRCKAVKVTGPDGAPPLVRSFRQISQRLPPLGLTPHLQRADQTCPLCRRLPLCSMT